MKSYLSRGDRGVGEGLGLSDVALHIALALSYSAVRLVTELMLKVVDGSGRRLVL